MTRAILCALALALGCGGPELEVETMHRCVGFRCVAVATDGTCAAWQARLEGCGVQP